MPLNGASARTPGKLPLPGRARRERVVFKKKKDRKKQQRELTARHRLADVAAFHLD